MRPPLNTAAIDTNVLGWLLQGRDDPLTSVYRSIVGAHPLVVPFQVLAELRYGMLRANWGELRVRRLERSLSQLAIAQPDDETVTTYARLRLQSVASGHPMGQKVHDGDRWIAAIAVRADLPLITHDAVFRDVDGLRILTAL